jgi:hypothetical protein
VEGENSLGTVPKERVRGYKVAFCFLIPFPPGFYLLLFLFGQLESHRLGVVVIFVYFLYPFQFFYSY